MRININEALSDCGYQKMSTNTHTAHNYSTWWWQWRFTQIKKKPEHKSKSKSERFVLSFDLKQCVPILIMKWICNVPQVCSNTRSSYPSSLSAITQMRNTKTEWQSRRMGGREWEKEEARREEEVTKCVCVVLGNTTSAVECLTVSFFLRLVLFSSFFCIVHCPDWATLSNSQWHKYFIWNRARARLFVVEPRRILSPVFSLNKCTPWRHRRRCRFLHLSTANREVWISEFICDCPYKRFGFLDLFFFFSPSSVRSLIFLFVSLSFLHVLHCLRRAKERCVCARRVFVCLFDTRYCFGICLFYLSYIKSTDRHWFANITRPYLLRGNEENRGNHLSNAFKLYALAHIHIDETYSDAIIKSRRDECLCIETVFSMENKYTRYSKLADWLLGSNAKRK